MLQVGMVKIIMETGLNPVPSKTLEKFSGFPNQLATDHCCFHVQEVPYI